IRDSSVTGVQTCALPIFPLGGALGPRVAGGCLFPALGSVRGRHPDRPPGRPGAGATVGERKVGDPRWDVSVNYSSFHPTPEPIRSEERRVGKEWKYRVSL